MPVAKKTIIPVLQCLREVMPQYREVRYRGGAYIAGPSLIRFAGKNMTAVTLINNDDNDDDVDDDDDNDGGDGNVDV